MNHQNVDAVSRGRTSGNGEAAVAGRHTTRMRRAQRGAAAVEFALVLPMLLVLLFGIVEVGAFFYDKAIITNASREGARAGIVLKSPMPGYTEINNAAQAYAGSYLLTFGKNSPPTVSYVPSATQGFGTPLEVTVKYVYTGLALGRMLSAFTGPITLSATTVMN